VQASGVASLTQGPRMLPTFGAFEMITGFRLVLASSVGERDGMAIELTRHDGTRMAEVFVDDGSGRRTVHVFEGDVPLDALEWLLNEAKGRR